MLGALDFELSKVARFNLFESNGTYHPLIVSINYKENGKNFAYISYCNLTKDSSGKINGVRSFKQIVLINGLPFQIKSIYGLSAPEKIAGEVVEVKG